MLGERNNQSETDGSQTDSDGTDGASKVADLTCNRRRDRTKSNDWEMEHLGDYYYYFTGTRAYIRADRDKG